MDAVHGFLTIRRLLKLWIMPPAQPLAAPLPTVIFGAPMTPTVNAKVWVLLAPQLSVATTVTVKSPVGPALPMLSAPVDGLPLKIPVKPGALAVEHHHVPGVAQFAGRVERDRAGIGNGCRRVGAEDGWLVGCDHDGCRAAGGGVGVAGFDDDQVRLRRGCACGPHRRQHRAGIRLDEQRA